MLITFVNPKQFNNYMINKSYLSSLNNIIYSISVIIITFAVVAREVHIRWCTKNVPITSLLLLKIHCKMV